MASKEKGSQQRFKEMRKQIQKEAAAAAGVPERKPTRKKKEAKNNG